MSEQADPFSIARMRASLYLFGVGKVITGLVGIVWMLTLVRALDVASYGGYIVLIAILEIVLLASNAGVYPFAQRYLTEARLPHNLVLLPALVWRSFGYRCITLALAAGTIAALAQPVASMIGQTLLAPVLVMYAMVILYEGATRYLELVFESLLEQGRAQLCALLRNGTRLAIVFLMWRESSELTLAEVIQVEAATSGLGLLLALGFMAHTLRSYRRLASPQSLPPASFSLRRLMPFALPLYLAQCLTQLYSPDTIKLIVSRLLGATEAASFGFAHALSYVLQRYLPVNLLIGLIRPMLVARRARGGSDQHLNTVGNLILTINLFLLMPIAALFAMAGDEFSSWASGGKYANAGQLLFLMTLLLALNGTHVVLAVLATALEDRRSVFIGTIVSVPGVLFGLWLTPKLGVIAMVLGLWVSELLWCSFTIWLLQSNGFSFRIDSTAWFKLFLAVTLSAAVAAVAVYTLELDGTIRLIVVGALIAALYPTACWSLQPLSGEQRTMLRRLLPARWQQ